MAATRIFAITVILLSVAVFVVGCGSDSVAPNSSQEAPLLPPQHVMTARNESGQVLLAWDANTQSNLAGYNIYRSVFNANTFTKINTSVLTATSYTDVTALANTTYEYRVVSVSNTNTESNYTFAVFFNGLSSDTEKHKKVLF